MTVKYGNRLGRLAFLLGAIVFTGPLLLFAKEAGAAEHADNEASLRIVSPKRASLSPSGARLETSEETRAIKRGNKSVVEFVLPPDTANLQIDIPGHTIAHWSQRPVVLANTSSLAQQRDKLKAEISTMAARLTTVKARLDLWQSPSNNGNAQDIANRQSMMHESMPLLAREKENLEEKLNLARQELAMMPANPDLGQLVTVTLEGVPNDQPIKLNYSYDYPGCGWNAIYNFNARPDEGNGDLIQVSLLADIWQYTGIDWTDTEISLANRGSGPRMPAPLPKWIVQSAPQQQKPQPKAATLNAAKARSAGAEDGTEAVALTAEAAPRVAPVAAHTDTVYASWQLSSKGLPDGRTRLQISEDAWQAPLQWLARPNDTDSRVWLFAQYDMPANKTWPSGQAQFSVNGQSVGEGMFRPIGGQATLYFGADPRVNIKTSFDSKKQGEIGIINASKTWTWAWTYTLSNAHSKAVKVKVERPAPMIVDDRVTVAYKNKPEAKIDDKKHMLYWEIDVPPNGRAEVEHSVIITSPVTLPLLPDVP